MPLLAFWQSNPQEIAKSSIVQIVTMAGDGNLPDGSDCSTELREYFTQIDTDTLSRHIEHCLSQSFTNSGFVFQDLVNELARRLDYNVQNGRYQGTTKAVGFDGLWVSPEGHTVIAEVKTTDAYRIQLDTIASYRTKLREAGQIKEPASMLILVGRQDTGELEAQIRGSRHAWDIRVMSADALLKLVRLKENSEETETGRKIRSLLTPMEFTRLDALVDVMFTTASDIEATIIETVATKPDDQDSDDAVATPSGWKFTAAAILDQKRSEIVDAMAIRIATKFIKKSRALYWDAAHSARIACSISKRYEKGGYPYWYAFHPKWNDFLGEGKQSFFVLGCVDLSYAFAIPLDILRSHLSLLNTTTTESGTYWHIHIVESGSGGYALLLPKSSSELKLDNFRITLK